MFLDRVTLHLSAGKGGNGIVAWRKEKYIPKGGPAGGDGGKGGDLLFEVDRRLYSLENFRLCQRYAAEDGQIGGTGNCRGRDGRPLILSVPCGTVVTDSETGELVSDLTEAGTRLSICRGGRGGRGNSYFKSPTQRAPTFATMGRLGGQRTVNLELKCIADIGLIGAPNAGKSSIFSFLTHSAAKIDLYPFTTLAPNIAFIEFEDYTRLTVADIPGIISDAHQNRGLGLDFLRHIDRSRLLLYVLDGDREEPLIESWRILRNELSCYSPELLERPYLILINKIDLPEASTRAKQFFADFQGDPSLVFSISAKSGEGFQKLIERLFSFTTLLHTKTG